MTRVASRRIFPSIALYVNPVTNNMRIHFVDTDGSTVVGGFRIRLDERPDYWDNVAGEWKPLAHANEVAPLPALNRIRWDKFDSPTAYSGAGFFIQHSAAIQLLPGSQTTSRFRLSYGAFLERNLSSLGGGHLEVYIGSSGDQTDTLVHTTDYDSLPPESGSIQITSGEVEIKHDVVAGDFLTLLLNNDPSTALTVQTSIDNGATEDNRTFLRLEQIA